MDLKMTGGIVARSCYRGVLNSWSDQQWAALSPEERPEGAIRFGLGWVQLSSDGGPGEGTGPVAGHLGARGHRLPPECVIVDPASPAVREFLHRATLEGLIRTMPAGPGRILVLPSDLWSRGRSRPDVPS